jgi:hypothetical protein
MLNGFAIFAGAVVIMLGGRAPQTPHGAVGA